MPFSVRIVVHRISSSAVDHAGAGSYYEPFDAQDIFDEIPEDALKIGILHRRNWGLDNVVQSATVNAPIICFR